MKITILGTRGEIEPTAPYHARHSGLLVDDTLMFDLGEQEFLAYKPSYIFITHLHPDHAYFVRDSRLDLDFKTTIFAPEPFKRLPIQVLSKKLTCGPYTITPIPTEHSVKVQSQAYLIQKGSERILYTGDMFWINKQHHHIFKKLDLVITEASFIRTCGMIRRDKIHAAPYGHAGVPNLIRLFKPYTSRLLLMHFGSWFYEAGARASRAMLERLGRASDIEVLVGYDGMIIDTKLLRK